MMMNLYLVLLAALLVAILSSGSPGVLALDDNDPPLLRKLQIEPNTDTNNPDEDNPCFSATASVYVRDKGLVDMKDLQVGDEVLSTTGSSSNKPSQQFYQRVYSFLHRKEEFEATFLQLHTDLQPSTKTNNKPLEITEDHLLYVQGKKFPVPAGSIVVGDILQQGGNNNNKPAKVTRITQITRKDGVYAPVTVDGTLVVDGIKVSSYVFLKEMRDHPILGLDIMAFLQHAAFSPYRFFCLWVSPQSKYVNSLNKDGLPPMVSLLKNFASWVVDQSFIVQVLSIFGYGVIAMFFWILECLLDPSIFVFGTAVAAMTTTFFLHKSNSKIIKSV